MSQPNNIEANDQVPVGIEGTEAYQKEIAAQYKTRVEKYSPEGVANVLRLLGFSDVAPADIKAATVGNVNATYLAPRLAIKLNQNRNEADYLANKLVADQLGDKVPVVKVLAYDFFEKTSFEVLVMERSPGSLLLKDIFELDQQQQIALYRQILEAVKAVATINFKDFGQISSKERFKTYSEFLTELFQTHIKTIRELKLCDEKDITKVEKYFLARVKIFDAETKAVLVHNDLHPGNILHQDDQLTAILDFDHSVQAPKMRVLLSLLGFIDKPSQFVEGTPDFAAYKDKSFYHLLPILKEELPELFADPQLLQKLNLHFISEGIKWIAGNWSVDWNRQMMRSLVNEELTTTQSELAATYYGRILAHK